MRREARMSVSAGPGRHNPNEYYSTSVVVDSIPATIRAVVEYSNIRFFKFPFIQNNHLVQ